MGKRFKKIFRWTLLILLLAIIGVIYFSPFAYHGSGKYRTVEYTVSIDAPVDSVFQFIGHSEHAADWSVYVHHIRTLKPEEYADGTVGSQRRCFCFEDETEQRWDEEIKEVVPNQKRQLSIFNLQKFPMEAKGLMTEQLYKKIDENTTELTLSVFYVDDAPSTWDMIKTKLGAYEIKRIFKGNLENIKRIIETKK